MSNPEKYKPPEWEIIERAINEIDELTLMLDIFNSSIVTGAGMPAKNSPCHKKMLELMKRNGRKPTAGER